MFVLVTSLCLAFSDTDIEIDFPFNDQCIQSIGLQGQLFKQHLALVAVVGS